MSFDRDIGIGIVGCGMISAVQVEAFRRVPGVRVVAFHDAVPAAAMARANEFGGTPHIQMQDLLANPDVDVVSICTPSGLHLEPAVQAARAGKHVIVEKPLEVTVDRVDAVLDACRTSGVTLAAVFPRRFFGSSQALKRAIDAGRFGTLVLATMHVKWFRSPEYYARGGWRGTYRYDGGGVLMNQGIHGIDLLQWLVGGVREVTAFTTTRAHPGIEVEDTAAASLVFRSGALGAVEGTTGAWPGERLRIEISGTEGSAVLEDESISAWRFQSPRPEDDEIRTRFGPRDTDGPGGATDPSAIGSEGHYRQFADFVAALRERRAPQVDGAEGRAAVAIITAIYRSAREGRPVTVDSR